MYGLSNQDLLKPKRSPKAGLSLKTNRTRNQQDQSILILTDLISITVSPKKHGDSVTKSI